MGNGYFLSYSEGDDFEIFFFKTWEDGYVAFDDLVKDVKSSNIELDISVDHDGSYAVACSEYFYFQIKLMPIDFMSLQEWNKYIVKDFN